MTGQWFLYSHQSTIHQQQHVFIHFPLSIQIGKLEVCVEPKGRPTKVWAGFRNENSFPTGNCGPFSQTPNDTEGRIFALTARSLSGMAHQTNFVRLMTMALISEYKRRRVSQVIAFSFLPSFFSHPPHTTHSNQTPSHTTARLVRPLIHPFSYHSSVELCQSIQPEFLTTCKTRSKQSNNDKIRIQSICSSYHT